MTGADGADAHAAGRLADLLAHAGELGGRAAPVHLWDPPHCGAIPMRIDAGGTWHYGGSPIRREAMVRLFASVLRREADGSIVLVTPAEKVAIVVDDAPFQAVEMAVAGEGDAAAITLRTNIGDLVTADAEHPLRLTEDDAGGFVPYVTVRGGLEARFTRPLALELADEIVTHEGRGGIWSGGKFFPVPQ
ncbi:DUF1285 domain-containing protein [Acuticoccus sp. MNP-M23]|uniref:DUF1285 domain-containing protein n=1 Tax=Acuticoccus sp. MNP-M23 TaxID=3072793 RepID=UPI002814DA83|nr:DUF1285 domain-containing protein [Acuticoccus sp. MNP-M23]WMS42753.1 DUF1285 domain-containing protein [Acuticoccus sp. MNP-M23]